MSDAALAKRVDRAGERLRTLADRLERLARGPSAIDSQLLFRIARPILAIAGWRTTIQKQRLEILLSIVRSSADGLERDTGPTGLATSLERAVVELEENVVALERVVIVRKQVPVSHVLWLRRVHAVLSLVHAGANAPRGDPARRLVAKTDPSLVLPPLVPIRDPAMPHEVPTKDHPEVEDARLVDLELAAIDHLIAAARAESLVLGRKRRLLVAARQRLLEASAALPLERDGVRSRATYLAREITRIDRLEAAGLQADVSLLHQARQALTRRDPDRLAAALGALDHHASSAGDHTVARLTGKALAQVHSGADPRNAAARSFETSAAQLLGDVAAQVTAAVDDARGLANDRLTTGGVPSERQAATEFLAYLPADAAPEIVRAAVAADGFFEVGGALSAIRVDEEERVHRLVRHPTQNLLLMPAEDVSDLKDAVIGDPRSILLDLATGRLHARRFVREEIRKRSRPALRAEVRVYILDGSGSMKGPRARVRDAILVAELSTLIRRLKAPGDMRCTLVYRYFDEELGPETRVDTVARANEAIRDVVGRQRAGGTDIEKALLASLDHVAIVRQADPDLARAQIVLVTDGESAVDEARIVAKREAIAGLPLGVSVIALGQENPALRGLVARQRAKGEPAFYHYLSDDELRAITAGQLDVEDANPIHAPERWSTLARDPEKLARALDDEVGGLLEELETLDKERDLGALERLEEEVQARREIGLHEGEESGAGATDGERARLEALRRDRVALDVRFARWFPDPKTMPSPPDPEAGAATTADRDDVEATCCALASVAEVVALLGGSPIARQADAIELLERLLPDARLTPGRYRAVLREHPAAIAASLTALRDAVRGSTP